MAKIILVLRDQRTQTVLTIETEFGLEHVARCLNNGTMGIAGKTLFTENGEAGRILNEAVLTAEVGYYAKDYGSANPKGKEVNEDARTTSEAEDELTG